MCVQVQGEDISPEGYHAEAGWTQACDPCHNYGNGLNGKPNHRDDNTSSKSKFSRSARVSAIPAARVPTMPTEEIKIVVRPRGGLDILKTGTTNVGVAILAAAGIESAAGTRDTICQNAQQNIMVASTPSEENAAKYARIQAIQLKASSTKLALIARRPTTDAGTNEIDRNIMNDRNPLMVGANRIVNTTMAIIAFQGHRVPNFFVTA